MKNKKRAIWHTDLTVEQCINIFKEKIPAVYNTPIMAKEKMITGEMQDNGDFNLTLATRSNKKDIIMCGNLKESEIGGTEINIKYKYSLISKIFMWIYLIIVILYAIFAILFLFFRIFPYKDIFRIINVIIMLFNTFTLSLSLRQSGPLFRQISDMYKCERKKI